MTLADLEPVIERYHHLIGANKFDEAIRLFIDRLHNPIYFQLANYNLEIQLLRALFPEGEDHPPRLQKEAEQAWTLNSLANSYALSGQPEQAVPLYLRMTSLYENEKNDVALAIGLENVAQTAQLPIGQLFASAVHLRKSIALCQQMKDEKWEAEGHRNLGIVLEYQGQWQKENRVNPAMNGERETLKSELVSAFELFEKHNIVKGLSLVSLHRALAFLLQARLSFFQLDAKENDVQFALQALQQAGEASAYEKKNAETVYPVSRDFVDAYWLVGEALLQCLAADASLHEQKFEVHFYDEPFQQITESLRLQKDNALHVAERCLSEALRRCRSVNMVDVEPNLLLAWARLEWRKSVERRAKKAEINLENIEEYLKEAREIAERAGYRLALADIHLFCAEVLLDLRKSVGAQHAAPLHSLTIPEHLQKAKDYALDISEFAHLYQSPDPHFYDGIPEAAMLKRGLTKQERIDNGYWVAYKIAEALEKRYARLG